MVRQSLSQVMLLSFVSLQTGQIGLGEWGGIRSAIRVVSLREPTVWADVSRFNSEEQWRTAPLCRVVYLSAAGRGNAGPHRRGDTRPRDRHSVRRMVQKEAASVQHKDGVRYNGGLCGRGLCQQFASHFFRADTGVGRLARRCVLRIAAGQISYQTRTRRTKGDILPPYRRGEMDRVDERHTNPSALEVETHLRL